MALSTLAVTTPGATGAPVQTQPAPPSQPRVDVPQLVTVNADSVKERVEVQGLPLDVTEHATGRGIDVVLYDDKDAQVLRDAGLTWQVKVPDLRAESRARARADRRYAATTRRSALPSGRTSYRLYRDYLRDMDTLVKRNPKIVKPIRLPNKTVLGRPVWGIEITTNVRKLADGKPVFLMTGAHHAREWPSSEHAMEYAVDLMNNYRRGNDRARRIVAGSRTIIVPIVNPDGFVISRNADPLGDFSTFDYEMKRKNCSVSRFTPDQYRGGTCEDNPAGRLRGSDLNRSYPGFWGGPGASANWSSDTFRSDGPGIEPEIRNIRRLISNRQVVTAITNHTYSNLVLRVPSIAATGKAPDEVKYKAFGDEMASHNGYTSQASYQLYDTSGSMEDWSYWNTGGFGFTFEIGTEGFHPPFEDGVVAEYRGLPPAEGAGMGGNREAYYQASLATLRRGMHATIAGRAYKGATLRLYKRFITATSPVIDENGNEGAMRYYEDTLRSTFKPNGGRFSWAVNQSTRPLVVGRYGREPQGPPAPDQELTNPPGVPAEGGEEQTTFTIEGLPQYDNGRAEVSFEWPGDGATYDWDYTILDPNGEPIASAATVNNPEVATIPDPVPGEYTVVAQNYAGGAPDHDWTGSVSFASPEPPEYSGLKEAWMLTCRGPGGRLLGTRSVIVDRGQEVRMGRVCTQPTVAQKKQLDR